MLLVKACVAQNPMRKVHLFLWIEELVSDELIHGQSTGKAVIAFLIITRDLRHFCCGCLNIDAVPDHSYTSADHES